MPNLGEHSFFWQLPTGLTEEEQEYYKVNATEMCDIFGALFTDGVTAEHMLQKNQTEEQLIGSSLAVIPNGGLDVIISVGSGMVNKHLYLATLPIKLPVSAGVTTDILLRADTTTATPYATAIARQRTSGDLIGNTIRTANIHEMPLATIIVPVGSQAVNETMIVDQRLNTNLASDGKPFCGLMKPRPNADTKGIWEDWTRLQAEIISQWNTFKDGTTAEWEQKKLDFDSQFVLITQKYNAQIAENQKNFEDWFANLQTYLDGDIAANLASEITKLKINKADKETTYTKIETDNKLILKSDKESTYTKIEVDSELSTKSEYNTATCTVSSKDYTIRPRYDKILDTQDLFDLKFIPPTDFDGKTLWVDTDRSGIRFTLYNSDGEKVQAGDGWKANVPVTIIFNKLTKKAFFKQGGSAVNQTLPPQVTGFAVTSGNAKVTVSFNEIPAPYNANLKDYVLVYKVGGIPTGVNDGIKVVIPK